MSDENNENVELEVQTPTDELPPTTDENAVVDDIEDVEEIAEPEPIEQVFGVYYYDKIFDDGRLGQFTESTQLAYQLGWQDNVIQQTDTEKDWRGYTYVKGYAQAKSLEVAKQQKLSQLKQESEKYSAYECETMFVNSSLGFKINADHKSQDNIRGLIALNIPTAFKDFDNQFHQVSVEDLNTLLSECYANGASLYQQKFNMELQISQLQDVEEVDNYPIVFTMSDFS